MLVVVINRSDVFDEDCIGECSLKDQGVLVSK